MKGFVLGLAVGAAAVGAAGAVAYPALRSVPLRVGESAYVHSPDGAPTCLAVPRDGVPSFRCYVADNPNSKTRYQKKFAVVINGKELSVTQYFGPNRAQPYKLIFRRIQTPTFIASR